MLLMHHCLLLLLSWFIVESSAAGHASFITPCKATDKECLLSSSIAALPYITAGISELGVPQTEPIYIASVRSDYPNFKLGFRNITISGISKCKIMDIQRNTVKNTIKLVAECPLSGVGQYDLNGKVLIIDAFGDGSFKIYTDRFKIEIESKIKEVQKDGHKYWKITGFDYTYEALSKIHMELENLFDGDETRAKPFRDLLDQSWKEIVTEFGDPIFKQLIATYLETVKKFFLAVPADELEIA